MKKLFFILLLLVFFVPTMAFSASDSYFEIDSLIDSGLSKNKDLISSMAADLSQVELSTLYYTNKKSAGVPFALNFFLGLGIGSFVQGDTGSGLIALCGELGSVALMTVGFVSEMNSIVEENYDYQTNTYTSSKSGSGMTLVAIGAIGYTAFRIYELIAPFSHASKYNKNLMATLMKNYNTTLSLVPVVNDRNEMGVTAVAKVKF